MFRVCLATGDKASRHYQVFYIVIAYLTTNMRNAARMKESLVHLCSSTTLIQSIFPKPNLKTLFK